MEGLNPTQKTPSYMPRPTLYARRTIHGPTSIYADKEATKIYCYYANEHPQRPRYGRKWVTLDCYRWKLEWLPDAEQGTNLPA